MVLEELKIAHFRSYSELYIPNFADVNCLIGENGSGKTNFLEAIYLLSSNRGFRTGDRKELTKRNAEGFFLQGKFDTDTIERLISDKKKSLSLNQNTISTNKLRTYNPVVAFSPNDIFLATGSSDTRRNFFDAAISLLDDDYPTFLKEYERAVRQRNHTLKKDARNADLWNPAIISNGSELIRRRIAFYKKLLPKVETLYQELAHGKATLKYLTNVLSDSSLSIEESFQDKMTKNKQNDLYKKHCTIGAHRDEISILINDLPAAKSGSQGQNRTLAFALKIGAVEVIEESLHRKPILLIDDALLEVDPAKRSRIVHKMRSLGLQLFLTASYPEFFDFLPSHHSIKHFYFPLKGSLS